MFQCVASLTDLGQLEIREESPRGILFRTLKTTDEGLTIVMNIHISDKIIFDELISGVES